MVVQELGWDNDTDDDLRVAIEDTIDADMVDGDYGNVVDAVVLWWRDEDGDLVDGLVDALTDLVGGGSIWLLTPKVGRPNAVDPADIAEAAPDRRALADDDAPSVSKDWSATRLIAPKTVARDRSARQRSVPRGVASFTPCRPRRSDKLTSRAASTGYGLKVLAESGILRPTRRSRWPGPARRSSSAAPAPPAGSSRWPR